MRIFKFLPSVGTGTGLLLAAAVLLAAPYGCSKDSKEAARQGTEEQAPPPTTQDPARAHFDKGVEFSLKGDLDAAVREYEAAIKIKPDIPEAHNNLGCAYMDQGDLDKAVDHKKKALELTPELAN